MFDSDLISAFYTALFSGLIGRELVSVCFIEICICSIHLAIEPLLLRLSIALSRLKRMKRVRSSIVFSFFNYFLKIIHPLGLAWLDQLMVDGLITKMSWRIASCIVRWASIKSIGDNTDNVHFAGGNSYVRQLKIVSFS